jgi:hypothetical protein
MPNPTSTRQQANPSGQLKQVNLRLGQESLRIARVLSARDGVSLTRYLEAAVDEAMKARADSAVQAAIEQSEHYRQEAEALKNLISSD